MADDVPVTACALECNGTTSPVISIIDQMAIPAGTAARASTESAAGPAPSKAAQEGSTRPAAEETTCGNSGGERQCEGNQEENDATQPDGAGEIPPRDVAANGQQSEDGPGRAGAPAQGTEQLEPRGTEPAGAASRRSPAAGAPTPEAEEHPGDEAWPDEEEEQEEDEEDTEEDEVQLIEIKKENSEESRVEKQDNGKEASPPASPTCNSQPEKPGEPPGAGKKNDISRHSYSRYNTISYRKIRKGNTKQRIDEFESMMHL
ncbi:PREDICTED: ermin [Tinamus guttatus]|uniref:ermin n=1 Tax=Tinamus guttatus TaxID=94827 RepID=UPI00052EF29B|nr:PREDICTED: ermin [Tinamus guttatus]